MSEHWTPFTTASGAIDPKKFEAIAAAVGASEADKAKARDMVNEAIFYINNLYQVAMRHTTCPMGKIIHLSIRRHDRKAIHDWRHFQRIKNELCGLEMEAVELYPAHSRLVDAANQYHLWVLAEPDDWEDPEWNWKRWPVGFTEGLTNDLSVGGAVQRPKEAS